MEGLDLSSLEQGIVDSAAMPSTPVVETEVVPASSGQADVVTPPVVKAPAPTPEQIQHTLDTLDDIIDLDDEGQEGGISSVIPQEDDEEISKDKKLYSALGGFLKSKGLVVGDDAIEDEDSFVAAISKTIQDSKYTNLNPNQLLYLKTLEAGIPEEEGVALVKNINAINGITPEMLSEDIALAENIIVEDLKMQGWSDDKISKQIERLKKTEEIVSESITSKQNILDRAMQDVEDKRTSSEASRLADEKAATTQLTKLKEAIFSFDKALSTVKVDDRLKNQVYEAMTKPVGQSANGANLNALMKDRESDPIDFEKRLYYTYVITNGFKDISRLQRRADSQAARTLKDVVSGINLDMVGAGRSGHDDTDDIVVPNIVNV